MMEEQILKEILKELREFKQEVNERFDTLEGRFNTLEVSLETFEGRFNTLEGKFNTLEVSLETFENKVIKGFNTVNDNFDDSNKKLVELDNKSAMLLADIKVVNRKLDRQSARLDIIFGTVKEHEIRLEDLEGISPPTV